MKCSRKVDKIIFQVPSSVVRGLNDPDLLMDFWDQVQDANAEDDRDNWGGGSNMSTQIDDPRPCPLRAPNVSDSPGLQAHPASRLAHRMGLRT